MSYKEINVNPFKRIQSDCFIRALSCATGKSWDYIYEHISTIAQSQGAMMNDRSFILNYLDRRYKRVPVEYTVSETAEKYSRHIVLITTRGHITCSKYGIIYDSSNPGDRIAEYCWIIL